METQCNTRKGKTEFKQNFLQPQSSTSSGCCKQETQDHKSRLHKFAKNLTSAIQSCSGEVCGNQCTIHLMQSNRHTKHINHTLTKITKYFRSSVQGQSVYSHNKCTKNVPICLLINQLSTNRTTNRQISRTYNGKTGPMGEWNGMEI